MPGSFDPHRKTFGYQAEKPDKIVVGGGKAISADAYEDQLWGHEPNCEWSVHHYMRNKTHAPCEDEHFLKCKEVIPKHEKEIHLHMDAILSRCHNKK